MEQKIENLTAYLKPKNELMEMAAIWMDSKIQTDKGCTVRLCKDMQVHIQCGKIINSNGGNSLIFTHTILKCMGNMMGDNCYFIVENNQTKEQSTITI